MIQGFAELSVVCIEVGGSGVETVLFAADGSHQRRAGAIAPEGRRILVAVPGLVQGIRVVGASSLGWFDVEPLHALGIDQSADLVLNDAEAAALGEVALRHAADVHEAVYLGLGTGVGGAVVRHDRVVGENLFGHTPGFSDRPCLCGQTGCLETVAAGWALPEPLDVAHRQRLAAACAEAIRGEPLASPELVVIAGGLARRYPDLCDHLARHLPDRRVEPSAAPKDVKSAAAWGLRLADDLRERVAEALG